MADSFCTADLSTHCRLPIQTSMNGPMGPSATTVDSNSNRPSNGPLGADAKTMVQKLKFLCALLGSAIVQLHCKQVHHIRVLDFRVQRFRVQQFLCAFGPSGK